MREGRPSKPSLVVFCLLLIFFMSSWFNALSRGAGAGSGGFVREVFGRVVEGCERGFRSVLSLEGEGDQVIGEGRVFWQHGTVQVAAEGVARHRALGTVLPVVAVPNNHAPERPRPLAEEG